MPLCCSIEDCDRPHRAKGLCAGHYRRQSQGQDLAAPMYTPGGDRTARVMARVDIGGPDECWEWTGHRLPSGYGTYSTGMFGTRLAARIVWTLLRGPIPDGKLICHHCDNPPCVNPAHLFVGTMADNMRDMALKGRQVSKLSEVDVIEIRRLLAQGVKKRPLARWYGVSQRAVQFIADGLTWRHVTIEEL